MGKAVCCNSLLVDISNVCCVCEVAIYGVRELNYITSVAIAARERVCKTGRTTGTTCATTSPDITMVYNASTTHNDLIRTSIHVRNLVNMPGDSGSPVYAYSETMFCQHYYGGSRFPCVILLGHLFGGANCINANLTDSGVNTRSRLCYDVGAIPAATVRSDLGLRICMVALGCL